MRTRVRLIIGAYRQAARREVEQDERRTLEKVQAVNQVNRLLSRIILPQRHSST